MVCYLDPGVAKKLGPGGARKIGPGVTNSRSHALLGNAGSRCGNSKISYPMHHIILIRIMKMFFKYMYVSVLDYAL